MPRSLIRALALLVPLAALVLPARPAAAVEAVVPDPVGDVFDYATETTGAFPPGDLSAVTIDLNAVWLRVGFELAQPSLIDPAVQDDWLGATSVVAALDLDGDSTDDARVEAFWDNTAGRAVGRVKAGDAVLCEAVPGFREGLVEVVVPATCLGAPQQVGVQGIVFWDVDAPGPNLPDYNDTAPDAVLAVVPRTEPLPTARLAGGDRVATAAALSAATFPEGADTAYLASAAVFADAVAAGSLTAGPVLLVDPCAPLPAAVRDELDRLGARRVVALGGPEAVCDAVLDEAAGEARSAARLAGEDRFETALEVSRSAFETGTARSVYLARADSFADSVAAGGLEDGPVLLVPSCGQLPDGVADEVARLGPDRVVALGSEAAVCPEMLAAAAGGVTTGRLGGESRFATAAQIALDPASGSAGRVYLANAYSLADAVAAGTLADGPVLLVPGCDPVPIAVRRAIDQLGPAEVVALGGPVAVCDDVLRDAAA